MCAMKRTAALLLCLLLLTVSIAACAGEVKLDGLTLNVPEEYAQFLSEREESTVLTLQKGDLVYSLTVAEANPPEIELSLILTTFTEGFFRTLDPEYALQSEETLYIGQTEVRLSTAKVKLSGVEATVMLLCRYEDGEVTLFSVVPLDGSAPEKAQLEELLAMISKPKAYRKGLTEEPVK